MKLRLPARKKILNINANAVYKTRQVDDTSHKQLQKRGGYDPIFLALLTHAIYVQVRLHNQGKDLKELQRDNPTAEEEAQWYGKEEEEQ